MGQGVPARISVQPMRTAISSSLRLCPTERFGVLIVDELIRRQRAVRPEEAGTETRRRRITRGGNGGKLGDIDGVVMDVCISDEVAVGHGLRCGSGRWLR